MNYKKHYDLLMAKARGRTLRGYKEMHHVLPRVLRGGDDPGNLVALTPEEHCVAHALLAKIYPEVSGLRVVATLLRRVLVGNKAYGATQRKKIGNKAYGEFRKLKHRSVEARRLPPLPLDDDFMMESNPIV